MSDHEAAGAAAELRRFVGIAGIDGACGLGEVAPRIQTGVEACDASHATLAAFPAVFEGKAGAHGAGFGGQSCQKKMKMPPPCGLAVFLTEAPEQLVEFDLVRLGRVTQQREEHGEADTLGEPLLFERQRAEELPGHLLEHMNVRAFHEVLASGLGGGGLGVGKDAATGAQPATEGRFKGGDAQLDMLVTQGGTLEVVEVFGAEDIIKRVDEAVLGAEVEQGEDLLVNEAALAGVGVGALFETEAFDDHGAVSVKR